jgi:hypothetical protein
MPPYDLKASITRDIQNIDLALIILNGMRDTNSARLALLNEAERREREATL